MDPQLYIVQLIWTEFTIDFVGKHIRFLDNIPAGCIYRCRVGGIGGSICIQYMARISKRLEKGR